MDDIASLCHSLWECKYHVVWILKYCRKVLFRKIRKELGGVFHRLVEQKDGRIHEGHLTPGNVHMFVSIPPKHAVAQMVDFVKGKSAIHIARMYGGRSRNFTVENFWTRGYFVSTVGRDEKVIREYILRQEQEDKRLDQLRLLE